MYGAPMRSGFTLLETMVVVTLLGVIAALALPSLERARQLSDTRGFAEEVYAFAARTRARAMTDRRCTRMRVSNATAPATLVFEVLNVFDCDDSADYTSAPRIAALPGNPLWVPVQTLVARNRRVTIALSTPPPDLNTEIRYRSSGRLWSSDTDLNEDDGALTIGNSVLTGTESFILLLESSGASCLLPRGAAPAPDPNGGFLCP